MATTKHIYVYFDNEHCPAPRLMGKLTAEGVRGREVFSFVYHNDWLKNPAGRLLDPDLGFFSGAQYLSDKKPNFGLFLDSSPDRWGRMLIKRREAVLARKDKRPRNNIFESDFLLGVFDSCRMGALRFKLSETGDFLDCDDSLSTPPWTSLSRLEEACDRYEKGIYESDSEEEKWIRMIFAPGSSLGGARPKANIKDTQGALWIAKFPSRNDERDMAAWEILAHRLACRCGIQMSESRIDRFAGSYHTFLTKRFDRTPEGKRIHFASAMTLLGANDGDDASNGTSYLDIVQFITEYGADVDAGLRQLWTRMVFNIAISNCDDHLRNHGFLLTPAGWILSPAYDINPDPDGTGLKLNIDDCDNSLDFSLATKVAPYFRLNKSEAASILHKVESTVASWPAEADRLGIPRHEQEYMRPAFRV